MGAPDYVRLAMLAFGRRFTCRRWSPFASTQLFEYSQNVYWRPESTSALLSERSCANFWSLPTAFFGQVFLSMQITLDGEHGIYPRVTMPG